MALRGFYSDFQGFPFQSQAGRFFHEQDRVCCLLSRHRPKLLHCCQASSWEAGSRRLRSSSGTRGAAAHGPQAQRLYLGPVF